MWCAFARVWHICSAPIWVPGALIPPTSCPLPLGVVRRPGRGGGRGAPAPGAPCPCGCGCGDGGPPPPTPPCGILQPPAQGASQTSLGHAGACRPPCSAIKWEIPFPWHSSFFVVQTLFFRQKKLMVLNAPEKWFSVLPDLSTNG